jgi:hypothetical protein
MCISGGALVVGADVPRTQQHAGSSNRPNRTATVEETIAIARHGRGRESMREKDSIEVPGKCDGNHNRHP